MITAALPQIQIASRTAGRIDGVAVTMRIGTAGEKSDVANGWAMASIAIARLGCCAMAGAVAQLRRWPSSTKSENGTRNFNDAVSQIQ